MEKINLTGMSFGKLTVIQETAPYIPPNYNKTKKRVRRWLCRCTCGNLTKVIQHSLLSGNTKSCGCGCIENRENILIKPNSTRCKYPNEKRLRKILVGMKQRCSNPKNKYYSNYGGRGITVCDEWLGVNGADNFCEWALSHGYKDGLTIDRIDNEKGYYPKNCRWVDRFEQMGNTRKSKKYTYKGKTQCLSKWAREYNLKPATLYSRLEYGWNFEKALLTPVDIKCWSKRRKAERKTN